MTKETKNFILATCVSMLVVLVWQTFYAGPQLERERQIQAQMHQRQAADAPPAGTPAGSSQSPTAPGTSAPAPEPQKTRADALAESPRIKLDAPAVYGSIALRGARLDDVSFKDYRETVNPNSPNIILLSPAGSPAPYFVEFGLHRRAERQSCPARPRHIMAGRSR